MTSIIFNSLVVGGVLNVPITKKLLAAAASSRMRSIYRTKGTKNREGENEKMDEIEELKERRKGLNWNIDSLVKSAVDFSVKAEETGQMTFVTKSNALRKAAKDKTL